MTQHLCRNEVRHSLMKTVVVVLVFGYGISGSFEGIVPARTLETSEAKRKGVMVSTLTKPFNGSGGVTVSKSGDIFVGDFGATLQNADGIQITRVTRDGTLSVFAKGFAGASGNAFDAAGNLYQANIAGNRVSKVTPDGKVTTFASENLINVVGVAVDADGNVFVANCQNPGRITKITPDGKSSILVTSALLSCPNGLTLDDQGNLYTCNFRNGNVITVTPKGEASLFATIPGSSNGHLTFANNRLYVVSRGGNRIYEVSLSGAIKLLAGSGECGKKDGPALQASFSFPNGIAASADGDTLYVNDAVPLCGADLNPVVVRMITGVKNATN